VDGFCFATSLASQRRDAFRCHSGHFIMDPCFSISKKKVNCPESASTNIGLVIRLTTPLPQQNVQGVASPLSFRIASGNGITCDANGTGISLTDFGDYEYFCPGNLVCNVPHASAKVSGAYYATCGVRTRRIVKNARTLFVTTIWQ